MVTPTIFGDKLQPGAAETRESGPHPKVAVKQSMSSAEAASSFDASSSRGIDDGPTDFADAEWLRWRKRLRSR
jgi:hypothetical protein